MSPGGKTFQDRGISTTRPPFSEVIQQGFLVDIEVKAY
jgi:hypothetical protein